MSRHVPIMRDETFPLVLPSPYGFSSPPSYYRERYHNDFNTYPRHYDYHHDFPLQSRSVQTHRSDIGSYGGDESMRKMTDEMNRMVSSMHQLMPLGSSGAPTVEDLRLSENFRMENPIRHEFDGSRKFNLQFDVQQFRPEEISVKTSGNQLTVHARHEEADSSGKKSYREYYRQYVLPKDVNPEFLNSKLTRNGTLQIEAPLPPLASSGHKGSMQDCIPVPADPEDPSDNKLWIGNLDHRLTELSLIKILQKYGKLKRFDFLYHKSGPDVGKPRGFCFVTYEEKHDAEKAIQKMNGKLALSKKLIVKWARKETQEKEEVNPTVKSPEYKQGPESQIKAIEAKLKLMERNNIDFSLDRKPVIAPGSSQLSAANIEARRKIEASTKPYTKRTVKR